MRKRFIAFILTLAMIAGMAGFYPGIIVSAEEDTTKYNKYGHAITYSAHETLHTGGKQVKFFDAGYTAWGTAPEGTANDEAKSMEWLSSNGYLLNHFGNRGSADNSKFGSSFNSNGEWQTKLKGPSNVKEWKVRVWFDGLTKQEERDKGNISGMYDKGDIEYFFAWDVKTVQTKWWGQDGKSRDDGYTQIFGEEIHSWGNHTTGYFKEDNSGPRFGDTAGWKSADKLDTLWFKATSNVDDNVDSGLYAAMLVGRDIKGPKINTIRVTADAAGTREVTNGVVSLETIAELDAKRTIYFQVEWDEPVLYEKQKEENANIENLKLFVQTMGIAGSGQIVEAHFLSYTSTDKTPRPVMTFEYQLPDPYSYDPKVPTDENGCYYDFKCVNVSIDENKDLWECIFDLSGNKFASVNGKQPDATKNKPVSATFSNYACVDLRPFGITAFEIIGERNKAFLKAFQNIEINLTLNKAPFKSFTEDVPLTDYPTITLNLKNKNNQYLTLSPKGVETGKQKSHIVKYGFRLTSYDDDYNILDGDFLKITSINFTNISRFKDRGGGTFMTYIPQDNGVLQPTNIPPLPAKDKLKLTPSPNGEFKVDFIAPVINTTVSDEGSGIYGIKALVDDMSLDGAKATITIKVAGKSAPTALLQYQSTTSESYQDTPGAWRKGDAGTMSASFVAPVSKEGGVTAAYAYFKLPNDLETNKVDITVAVTDNAGNRGTNKYTLCSPGWNGFDRLAPRSFAYFWSMTEQVILKTEDMDTATEYRYGYSLNDQDAPGSYSDWIPLTVGEEALIPPPPNESLTPQEINERVVWIEIKDSNNNIAIKKATAQYDRTYVDIEINSADTQTTYEAGHYPTVDFTVKHAKLYWYRWAERPARSVENTESLIANDAGQIAIVKSQGANLTYGNESVQRTLTLTDNAIVQKVDPDTEKLKYDSTTPGNTTRPIMLVIIAEDDDGKRVVKTVEFNTVYAPPMVSAVQTRFSTNDYSGKRVDYLRADGNLIWPTDDDSQWPEYSKGQPVNTPNLFGIAQAEFVISKDPGTGFDRIDFANSSITLEKVLRSESRITSGQEVERTVLETWKLNELTLINTSEGNKLAIVDFDPNSEYISHQYYEYKDGECYTAYYEFVCNLSYTNNLQPTNTTIAHYLFCDMPTGILFDINYDSGYPYNIYGKYPTDNVEAVFDNDGNDITNNIPVYAINTLPYEEDGDNMYIRFSVPGGDYGYQGSAYYRSPMLNMVDPANTYKLAVHIGTDANNLSDIVPIKTNWEYDFYATVRSDNYAIPQELFGNDDEVREVTLYYKFVNPERGSESPVYVLKLRRDNVAPVFDVFISETNQMVKDVLVKLNSVYDVQTGSDGTVFEDTPEHILRSEMWFEAWRDITEEEFDSIQGDEYDPFNNRDADKKREPGGRYYARVRPDQNGFYHFITNGYIYFSLEDYAGNYFKVLVNGKEVVLPTEGGETDMNCYHITNVDCEPPAFVTDPVFAAGDGKFTLTAKADQSVNRVYLKFDDTYSEYITGSDAPAGIALYDIKRVPGLLSGAFNATTGDINAEIYVKYSDTVKLTSVTVIIEDAAGNRTESPYVFGEPIAGKKAEITNPQNADGLPVYNYGETLTFNVPVKIVGLSGNYATSHNNLAIYTNGKTSISYINLFGDTETKDIYANIFESAFAHTLKFYSNNVEISPDTPVNTDVTVKIDTSKTSNLTVEGGISEIKAVTNGLLTYSLTNTELGQTETFSIPIVNIDRTAPDASVSLELETETDIQTGASLVYSATYVILGYSEDDVTLIANADGSAPSYVTFDANSVNRTYTFRFRDAAGNEGSYTVDASNIVFTERTDKKIAGYRLTYTVPSDNGFSTLGQFRKGEEITGLGLVNMAVSVRIETLNAAGDVVSSIITANDGLPQGVSVYNKQKLVMFTTESDEDRVVNLTLTGTGTDNDFTVPVKLPANTMDLTAPSGTVNYKADGLNVKAYLVTQDTDIRDDGISVTGAKSDGTPFELKHDAGGYYVELDMNGTGKFVLMDKAGNVGNVLIAVLTIDTEAPKVVLEGWQSIFDANASDKELLRQLLETPTNSSIKVFITCNEMLKNTEVTAYENDDTTNELQPTDDYVTAITSGPTVVVEFKQNCRAKLVIYDLRGNGLTLWRPDDGPIASIDKETPKPAAGYPERNIIDNKEEIKYVFANGEPVMLLQKHENGYKNQHTITFEENGPQTLNFADRAGNVYTDHLVISQIDDLAPNVKVSLDFVGEGAVLSPEDSYKAGNVYTSKDVRILLNVTDEGTNNQGLVVTAKTRLGASLAVNKEAVTANEKDYNYNFVVTENGSYEVTATDKWGNKNVFWTNVSVIDREGPTVRVVGNNVIVLAGTSAEDAKESLLELTTAFDTQSGANAPLSDKMQNVNDGVTLAVDFGNVDFNVANKYLATITATDRLGNVTNKNCTVSVVENLFTINLDGMKIYAFDTVTGAKGKHTVDDTDETTKYYYSAGYKTLAEMKYAKAFKPEIGFYATQDGYYTIMAKDVNRNMYLIYLFIY
ncbi:MAG TPA: hypothetical protein PLB20_08470 [Clostridia bacterium]|nr:hypothetical protein [Clostridia bacterium]